MYLSQLFDEVIREAKILEKGSTLFGSFFLGGFECATHRTLEGHRLDVIKATQHDTLARQDYELCRSVGIRAVREAARWPIIDQSGVLDLEGVRQLARMAREVSLTQIWDLMHYGYPDDLDPFSSEFAIRFASYARAVAQVVLEETEGPRYYTPINEISYCSWAAGEVGYMAPFAQGRGGEYKRALVRAAIKAANAIWEVDPQATMFNVDPLVRLHAPEGRPDLQDEADHFNQYVVTEAFDLLSGRIEPELGGTRAHLGLVGFNYYAGNQWTIATPESPQRFLGWDDPRWIAISDLLSELQNRYGGPIFIAETGSSADGRVPWLSHLTREALRSIEQGVDLQGICLYPIITSPDWEDPTAFFDGGLFDVSPQPEGTLERVLSLPLAKALREAQALLDPRNLPSEPLAAEANDGFESHYGYARPIDVVHYKADNFSYQTLFAGEQLVGELYGIEPGNSLASHRHDATEHVLTFLSGTGDVRIENKWIRVKQGETVLIPARLYHGIHNYATERLVVLQVSGPKPWDARFAGPHPRKLD